MGFSGISPWSLVLILIIVLVIFGTKRLRDAGGDLGGAIKSFKKSMSEASDEAEEKSASAADPAKKVSQQDANNVIDSEATQKDKV